MILKTAELPSLCNVVSFICQLFVAHFAMAVFMCLFTLSYKMNKQRDTSLKFCSILSTVDLSKHLLNHGLNHSKFHTVRQFCDFQCLLFLYWQSSVVKPVS